MRNLTVYDEINTYVDKSSGEVISTAHKQVVRREKTPEFVMLFIQGLSILTKSELTKTQGMTLHEILKYTVSNSNMLMLNADTRKLIANDIGSTKRTIDQNINTLVTKEILVRKGRTYFLSPLIFGKGNWNDVKKLTQNLEIEYDFEKQTAQEKITTKSLYYESEELEHTPHKVIDANEIVSDNHIEQKIIVEEDNDMHPNQGLLEFNDPNENIQDAEIENKNDDLEMIKEQNKSKELEIETMKLKLEMKREGLI